ncbi:MAG: hypothetical protein V4760_11340 [Bdellovibrionota bacterium]
MTHVDRFLKVSLLIASFAALVGCMKDVDTPAAGGGNALSLKDETDGTFTTLQSAPLENGSTPTALELPLSAACATLPVEERSKFSFDDRLGVGDVFVHAFGSTNGSTGSKVKSTTAIESRSATTIVSNSVLSDITLSPNMGFPPNATFSYKTTCTQAVPGEYPDCKIELSSTPPGGGGPSTSDNCSYTWDNDPATWVGLAERGTFKMQSGVTTQALRVTRTIPVSIKCTRGSEPERDLGKGLSQSTTITTNDVVSEHARSCYSHTTLYSFSAYAQDGGILLDLYKDELLSAPVR